MTDWSQRWDHQRAEVALHTYEPGWFLFWDPRTGKTRTCVDEMSLWIANCGVMRILVVAPMDGCNVWLKDDELGRFDPTKVVVLSLSTEESIAQRSAELKRYRGFFLPVIVVVNRDVIFKERLVGKEKKRLQGLLKTLKVWGPQALILDESQDYRKVSSQRSLAAYSLAQGTMFRRALSGTPDPTSYIDYYSQYKIIAPRVFGTSKKEFQARYCQMNYWFPNKVDHYVNTDELQAKLFSVASRVRQQDCFDMPPELPDEYVDVPFPRLLRELYNEIKKEGVADFLGLEIDGTHQLARLTILHQLAAGFIRDEGNPEWVFDGKIEAAHRYVAKMMAAGKRIVIYHHFKPEGKRLYDELAKRYGEGVVGSLNGDTPRKRRSAYPFLANPQMRIFIAQEDTAQVSISLKESDHVLWYSWGPESDVNEQCRQRIFADRAEKPHGLSYTFLRVPFTVDDFMTTAYKTKRSRSQLMLDYFGRAA